MIDPRGTGVDVVNFPLQIAKGMRRGCGRSRIENGFPTESWLYLTSGDRIVPLTFTNVDEIVTRSCIKYDGFSQFWKWVGWVLFLHNKKRNFEPITGRRSTLYR